MTELVGVNVTITKEQKAWVNENHIKLSSFIRSKLEEEMNDE